MRIVDAGRGAHPRLRASAFRMWTFDETVRASSRDLIAGHELTAGGLSPEVAPFVVEAHVGQRARRFVTSEETILVGDGDADSRDLFEGEHTVGMWLRLLEAPVSGTSSLAGYLGNQGDGDGDHNYLWTLRLRATRQLEIFHEWGDGTDQLSGLFPDFTLPLYRWVYLVVRKYNVTGAGAAGVADFDLYANGELVGQLGGVTNSDGGALAKYVFGGVLSSSGATASQHRSFDLAGFYVWSAPLEADEIREDFRRGLGLPFYTYRTARVLVEDSLGRRHALDDLDGGDFTESIRYTDDVDADVRTARVTAVREEGDRSLALLRTDSLFNLLDPLQAPTAEGNFSPLVDVVRTAELKCARVPLGLEPSPRDFFTLLEGPIDPISWGEEAVEFVFTDEGGRLLDAHMEEDVEVGDDEIGQPLEEAQQTILDAMDSDAKPDSYPPVTLYVKWGISPSWNLRRKMQTREIVLHKLRAMSAGIAWDTRYLFDPNPDEQRDRLTLFEPERSRVDADLVLEPDEILNVREASVTAKLVRNIVRVPFDSFDVNDEPPTPPAGYVQRYATAGADAAGNPTPAYVELENVASREKWKRRFMEFQEGSASNVDTFHESHRMALGACEDTCEPEFSHTLELAALPELEVNDMMRLPRLRQVYTGEQKLTVRGLETTMGPGGTTAAMLRGKPSVGFKRWLALDARNGAPPRISPDEALADVPAATLLASLSGLMGRTDFFAGGKYLAVRNHDFSTMSRGVKFPPDGWEVTAGAWSVDVLSATSPSLSGGRSVLLANTTARLASSLVPIEGSTDRPYSFEATWQRDTTSERVLQMEVQWLAGDRETVLATTTLTPGGAAPNWASTTTIEDQWITSKVDGVLCPDDDARFVRLILGASGGVAANIYVDQVSAYRTARESFATVNFNNLIPNNAAWRNVVVSLVTANTFDFGDNLVISSLGVNGTHFLVKLPGRHRVTASLLFVSSSPPQYGVMRVVKNATYGGNRMHSSGEVLRMGNTTELVPRAALGLDDLPHSHAAIVTLSTVIDGLVPGDRLALEARTSQLLSYLGNEDTGVDGILVSFLNVKHEALE